MHDRCCTNDAERLVRAAGCHDPAGVWAAAAVRPRDAAFAADVLELMGEPADAGFACEPAAEAARTADGLERLAERLRVAFDASAPRAVFFPGRRDAPDAAGEARVLSGVLALRRAAGADVLRFPGGAPVDGADERIARSLGGIARRAPPGDLEACLGAAVDDPSDHVRRAAAAEAGEDAAVRGPGSAAEAFAGDPDPGTRLALAEGGVRIGAAGAFVAVPAAHDPEDDGVRAGALDAMARVGTEPPDGWELWLRLFDPSGRVRGAALRLMGRGGRRRAAAAAERRVASGGEVSTAELRAVVAGGASPDPGAALAARLNALRGSGRTDRIAAALEACAKLADPPGGDVLDAAAAAAPEVGGDALERAVLKLVVRHGLHGGAWDLVGNLLARRDGAEHGGVRVEVASRAVAAAPDPEGRARLADLLPRCAPGPARDVVAEAVAAVRSRGNAEAACGAGEPEPEPEPGG